MVLVECAVKMLQLVADAGPAAATVAAVVVHCRWTGIYAYNPSTNQLIKSSSGACVRFRTAETDATRLQQFFGDCGVAPKYFANVPTIVCMEDASECNCGVVSNAAVAMLAVT